MRQQTAKNLRRLAKQETVNEKPITYDHTSVTKVDDKNFVSATVVTYPRRRTNYMAKKRAYCGLNHIQRGAYNAS